jgi:hypothetical protein
LVAAQQPRLHQGDKRDSDALADAICELRQGHCERAKVGGRKTLRYVCGRSVALRLH